MDFLSLPACGADCVSCFCLCVVKKKKKEKMLAKADGKTVLGPTTSVLNFRTSLMILIWEFCHLGLFGFLFISFISFILKFF